MSPPLSTTGAPASLRHHRLALGGIYAVTLGCGLIFGFQPPLMAFVLARSGASSFEIGAVIGTSTIAVILFGPLYPRLIARLGLKRAVVIGIALGVLILPVMALLPSVPAWIALRFLNGCAVGLAWVASEVWLNRLSTDTSRGTVIATYATVFAIGVMAGPLLLQLFGTEGARPFVAGSLCLALTSVPLLLVRDTGTSEPRERAPPLWRLLRAAPVVMLAAFCAGLVESADVSLLPVFGLHRGLDEHAALLLLTVFLAGNVILQLPIGRCADRFGRRRVLAVCALVSVIGPLLLPALMPHDWILRPLLFIWGGLMYGFYTQGIALLGESFRSEALADANALFVIVYCGGGVLGPSLGGLVMDLWTPNGLVVFLSAAAGLLLVGLLVEYRRGIGR